MEQQHNVCGTIPGTMDTEPLGIWQGHLSQSVDDIGNYFFQKYSLPFPPRLAQWWEETQSFVIETIKQMSPTGRLVNRDCVWVHTETERSSCELEIVYIVRRVYAEKSRHSD